MIVKQKVQEITDLREEQTNHEKKTIYTHCFYTHSRNLECSCVLVVSQD